MFDPKRTIKEQLEEKLREIDCKDPHVRGCLACFRNGELSREEALIFAVLHLCTWKDETIRMLIEGYWRTPLPPPPFTRKESDR